MKTKAKGRRDVMQVGDGQVWDRYIEGFKATLNHMKMERSRFP